MTTTALEERAWWDEIASDPLELDQNVCDPAIASAAECLAEIVPALAVSDGALVLDLGCGPGRLTLALAQQRPEVRVIGLDVSTRMVDAARSIGFGYENVKFARNDGRTLPDWVEADIDAAYSMLMFQHIPADACAGYVKEVARVLRPGGRFRFQTVIGTAPDHFLSHQSNYAEMTAWCEDAGLEVVESGPSRLYHEWSWMTARKP